MTFLWIGLLALVLLVPVAGRRLPLEPAPAAPGRRALLEPVADPRGAGPARRACGATSRSRCSRRASRRW